MNIDDAFATALGMPHAPAKPQLGFARSIGSECTARSKWISHQTRRFWHCYPNRCYGRWKIPALMLASVFLVASCVGTEQTIDSRNLTLSSAGVSDTQTAEPVTQGETRNPQLSDPLPDTGGSSPPELPHSEPVAHDPTAGVVSPGGTSPGGQHVSLRPKNNILADDLLDHWGHRHGGPVTARLSEATDSDGDVADFQTLLEAARGTSTDTLVPGLQDDDTITVLGRRHGVTYGRWSGGPADTLSIEFDLQDGTAALKIDSSFRAALERAGKAWSRRIEDTWEAWEREAGESKGALIGNFGIDGREIRVGPGGETSTGLTIFITGVDLAGDIAGWAGPRSWRSVDNWEPHTGAIGLDIERVEEMGEAGLFRTMVHEIGHVLGAWYGYDTSIGSYASFIDSASGTWTGPRVVAVHGGPAPFQDNDDTHDWRDGERSPDASNFDFGHSGVCASVMAYCGFSAAITAFRPVEIDFAFLADLGLTIKSESDRPETYGLSGWMDHSAFTLSVSRELDVSFSDTQPRYFINGAQWESLDTVDLLWAEADAFGNQSTGNLAVSFLLAETVRYSGGLIGTAVEYPGLPSVYGDANLSVGLDSLTGKASFTSLEAAYNGDRYVFGDGSLHYPITVADNGIRDNASGVSLIGDFYGPRHEEIAGTLDDSRAGLLASFGAKHDERPAYLDVITEGDHVRGMMYQDEFNEVGIGWHRFRCGEGSACEGKFEWWEPDNDWYDVNAEGDRSPRERMLSWTAGWGDWVSEDMFADHGAIRIARRYASETDGGTGRYQQDGYYGTMKHAAFGTGFQRFYDWEESDAEQWNHYIRGTGFQGDLSGTRPAESATWGGRMLGHQSGLETGEDPFVEGRARVRVSLYNNQVDVEFSNVRSTDRGRSLANFGFDDITLASDGTFDGFDEGPVEGAFFGPAHEEVAGMFHKNDISVLGSFGAVSLD